MSTTTQILFIWFLTILLCLPLSSFGQSTPTSTTFACGTVSISRDEALKLDAQAKQALQNKRNKSGNALAITYVPIRPHIVRRSDGTGGFSMASMNRAMALTNARFLQNNTGIQFYFAGVAPNYIDSDTLYNKFPYYDPSSTDVYLVTNAMNQFYAYSVEDFGGYASFPFDGISSTRSVVEAHPDPVSDQLLTNLGRSTIPHELGHNFSLLHTHGNSNVTDELVTRGAGANCTTAGDLLCDTPADPSFRAAGVNSSYSNNCPVYDPASTARDANGDAYDPPMTNIMGYWHNTNSAYCNQHDFTPGQAERMQAALALRQTHTSYTLDAPPTAMTPPSNLVATGTPVAVTLIWQDNSTTEMGYFIERSTSSAEGFVPVGGVAPNITTFIDNAVSGNTRYYYRIRPSNTTTGQLSPVADTFTGYCQPLYANGCGNNNGLSSVIINGVALSQNSGCSASGYGQFTTISTTLVSGQRIPFSITLLDPSHPHGITIWADLNRNFSIDLGEDLYLSNGPVTGTISGTFTIPESVVSGSLMVRVLSAYNTMPFWPCSTNNGAPVVYDAGEAEDYTVQVQQRPITGLTTTSVTGTSAQLNWNSLGSGITYELQYRQQGDANWTVRNAVGNSWQLSLLSINTAYEWRVREAGTTLFSGPVSFTTLCPVLTNTASYPARTSVMLSWDYFSTPSLATNLRWRVAGTANWTTVSSLTSNSYSLTGLSSNTAYEWQVQLYCADFSPIRSFTTLACLTPYSASTNNLLSSSVYLSWLANYEPTTTYRLQYRPTGNPTWQTVESLTANGYSLTGLTANTTYEWQVQSVCSPTESSGYLPGPAFTPLCPVPIQPYGNPTATGATLTWQINPAETVNTFSLQYRQTGTTNWTTINNLIPTASYSSYRSYSLMGLSRNAAYEWRIRTNCTADILSDYTTISSFTTICTPAYAVNVSQVSSSAARLYWYAQVDTDTRFEIRWRQTGSPNWTAISNLTASQGQGNYLLTGLAASTSYEWQVRTICSPNEMTDFTSLANFQSLPPCSGGMYTVKAGNWLDPTVWSCNRIPFDYDVVTIRHMVTLFSNGTGNALKVQFEGGGKIYYSTNSRLRLGL